MSEKPGNGKKREGLHPSVESADKIEEAFAVCNTILASADHAATDEGAAYDLLEVCRQMTIGQLAYTLLHLGSAQRYPERDYAVAAAFKEKYNEQAQRETKH